MPAPFFVLDEIDAALDNTNIGKVQKLDWKVMNIPILTILPRGFRLHLTFLSVQTMRAWMSWLFHLKTSSTPTQTDSSACVQTTSWAAMQIASSAKFYLSISGASPRKKPKWCFQSREFLTPKCKFYVTVQPLYFWFSVLCSQAIYSFFIGVSFLK